MANFSSLQVIRADGERVELETENLPPEWLGFTRSNGVLIAVTRDAAAVAYALPQGEQIGRFSESFERVGFSLSAQRIVGQRGLAFSLDWITPSPEATIELARRSVHRALTPTERARMGMPRSAPTPND